MERIYKGSETAGIDGSQVRLGIMDSLAGLEKVFKEKSSPRAKTQRCQVHRVAKDIIAKVTKKQKRK
ncbi:MAG: transposase [Candidatus Brocadiaceae bacterium]